MKISKFFLSLFIMSFFFTGNSEAALLDRGAGLIYDNVLNITWLQNANYIETAGQPGRSNWGGAATWADQLTYYDSIRNITWSDWRLPTTINHTLYQKFYDTNPSIENEMAYMYYINLGFQAKYNDSDEAPVLPVGSLVQNLIMRGYWTGTASDNPGRDPWIFHFHYGFDSIDSPNDEMRAWAVRDGDVASVPLPGAALLLASGLVGIICRKKISHT